MDPLTLVDAPDTATLCAMARGPAGVVAAAERPGR
jgi:hypothetical protein